MLPESQGNGKHEHNQKPELRLDRRLAFYFNRLAQSHPCSQQVLVVAGFTKSDSTDSISTHSETRKSGYGCARLPKAEFTFSMNPAFLELFVHRN
jgi:hypothetical protein